MSVVEQTLRTDPGGAYAAMDFASRDRYRHAVEEVAKASGLAEDAVASRAIALARAGAARHGSARPNGARGLLSDRPRAGASWKTPRGRAFPWPRALRRAAGRSPLLLYLGAITLITVLLAGGLLAEARADGCGRLGAAADRHARAVGHQPARGRAGELAGHLAGVAASAAAHGLLRGHPAGIAHPGGDPDHARQPAQRRGPGRGAGGPVPGQSRREPALRPADGLSRRGRGNAGRGRTAAGAGPGADRSAECAVRRRQERCLLPVSSPAPLESPRPDLDGLRAQARQAGGPEPAAAGGQRRRLLPGGRRDRGARQA